MGEAAVHDISQDGSGNLQPKAGWIKQMTLTNFMCHSLAKIDFIENVNFITGQNGSGKSAILTALCVAFGTNAKSTQRATNLKDFIKTGEGSAIVEVVLCNEGSNPYKLDSYGDTIVLERRLTDAGGSFFTLKNSRGKKVTSKREEVEDLAAHFLIQVDNPCIVMTQDKSREFLHSGNPKEKFKFFSKATLLESMVHIIQDAEGGIEIGEQLLLKLKSNTKPIEEKVKNLEEQVAALCELEDMQENIDNLKKLIAWRQVYDLNLGIDEERKATEDSEVAIEECNRQLEGAKLARVKAEKAEAGSKEILEEAVQRYKEVEARRKEAMQDLTETTRRKAVLEAQNMSKKRRIKECNRERASIQKLIEQAENDAARETQAEATHRDDELAAKEHEARTAEEEYQRLQESAGVIERRCQELESQKQRINQQVNDVEGNKRDNVAWQRRLQDQSGNRTLAFGGRQALNVLQQIEHNIHRFSKLPIGPIGAHLSLREEKYAMAVEVGIGGLFNYFIVANSIDQNVLRQLGKSIGINNMAIIISDYNNPPIQPAADSIPGEQLVTIERVLNIGDHIVRNVLIDVGSIERVVLFRNYEDNKELAFSRDPRIKECIDEIGNKYSVRGGVEAREKPPRHIKGVRLMRNIEAELVEAQRTIEQLEQQRRDLQQELTPINAEIEEGRARLRKARTLVQKQDRIVRQTKSELRSLQSQAQVEPSEPEKVDVSNYVRQEQDLEEEIRVCNEELEVHLKELEKVKEMEQAKKMLERETASALEAHADEVDKLEEDNLQNQLLIQEISQAISLYEDDKKKKEAKRRHHADQLEKLQKEQEINRQKASLYCEEPSEADWVGVPQSAEHLGAKIQDLQRKQATHHRRQGDQSKEEAQQKLNKEKKKLHVRSKELGKIDSRYTLLKKTLGLRRKALKQRMEYMRQEVNWHFGAFLHRKGATGKVTIDFGEQTLSMEIKLPSDRSMTSVKDTRALSGGERSFSTLCYALTLHNMVEAPFRAMDEFDIFMDNVTRKICLDEAVRYAVSQGSQWIFITPHDISMVEAGPQVKKQQMASPRTT